MHRVAALIISGLILSTTGCVKTQTVTRTETVREKVPAEYLQPTQIPAPSRQIDQCPIWGEQLKQALLQCNADKADALEWSTREPAPQSE